MDMMEVIEYDPEADILLIRLRPGKPRDEQLLDSDVVIGLDEKGEVLYVEVWDASRRGLAKALAKLARAKREKMQQYLSNPSTQPRASQVAQPQH